MQYTIYANMHYVVYTVHTPCHHYGLLKIIISFSHHHLRNENEKKEEILMIEFLFCAVWMHYA